MIPATRPRWLGRWRLVALGSILVLTAHCATVEGKPKKQRAETVEDLLIVDCLLPGQIRQLGRKTTYLTQRKGIRTSAVDCRIRGGEYVAYDRASYTASRDFWQPLADGGDPEAQTHLGEIYEKGLLGTPDYELAAVWYRKAAEGGHARAQTNLAHLYEQGLGVPQDTEKAAEWYRKAAGISENIVLDSRAEAAALRQELEGIKEELKASEHELAEARSELERSRAKVDDLRRRLEEAQASGTPAEEGTVQRLSAELQQQEEALTRSDDRVQAREQALAELRQRAARARDLARETRTTVAGPSIEIVRPDVLTTRGPVIVPVPPGTTEMEISGRVTAPAGVEELTVEGRPLDLDASGFFATEVACSTTPREVSFVVTDRAARSARATLILQPSDREPLPPPAPGTTPLPSPVSEPAVASLDRALIISVADYGHFSDLATAATDARAVADLLARKYGFQTRILQDPSNMAILQAFETLHKDLRPENNLLIYYAGHGKVRPPRQRGFWIPANAESDDDRAWIANELVSDYLSLIPARHILVVSDSCYSGTLSRSGLARLAPDLSDTPQRDPARAVTEKRSRTVLTSGGLQPVLDRGGGEHSLFAGAFLRVLALNDGELRGADLHREVAARVTLGAMRLGVDQIPEYAPIRFAGHEAGDFVLRPVKMRPAAAGSR